MAKQFTCIEPHHHDFILQQRIFFTASAAAQGHVNVSPKDGAALRILSPNSVAYLDQTGSGNETAAHLRAHGRLTIMFCAFAGAPQILRLYGQGKVLSRAASPTPACSLPRLRMKNGQDRARSWCSPLIWSRHPADMAFLSLNMSTSAQHSRGGQKRRVKPAWKSTGGRKMCSVSTDTRLECSSRLKTWKAKHDE